MKIDKFIQLLERFILLESKKRIANTSVVPNISNNSNNDINDEQNKLDEMKWNDNQTSSLSTQGIDQINVRKSVLLEIIKHFPYPDKDQKGILQKYLEYQSIHDLNEDLLALRRDSREISYKDWNESTYNDKNAFLNIENHFNLEEIPNSNSDIELSQQISIEKINELQLNSITKIKDEKISIERRKKRIISEFIQRYRIKNSLPDHIPIKWSDIPIKYVKKLAMETELSRKQLRFQIEYLSSRSGRVSNEKRKQLVTYLKEFWKNKSLDKLREDHEIENLNSIQDTSIQEKNLSKSLLKLNQEEYNFLEEKLGLSKYQLYSMIHYYTEKHGNITTEIQKELESLIKKRINDDTKQITPFTKEELVKLKKKFGLSIFQLRFQIKRITQHNKWSIVTEEKKQKVISFLNEFPNPTQEQLLKLRKELNFHKDQFRQLLYRIHNPYNTYSKENREHLINWLKKNNYRKPESLEIEQLMQETKLGRRQIHSMIATLRDPVGELTIEKKEFVLQFIKNQGVPTRKQIEELQKQLKLGKKQLQNLIASIIDPTREFTQEKKDKIFNYLKSINFRKPSTLEKKELSKNFDLSLKQLTEHIRYVLSKHTSNKSKEQYN